MKFVLKMAVQMEKIRFLCSDIIILNVRYVQTVDRSSLSRSRTYQVYI